MRTIYKTVFIVLLFVIIFFSSWPIIQGNIAFHTDIARDFLLLEDVYYNKNITLIGPRSGGIPGVFHGPMWLYLNLPAYILGGGNPLAVGWFWVFLFVVSIAAVYEVARRMFDENTAMISSLVYASALGSSVYAFFNPAGAVLLFPIFFYLFWLYTKKENPLVLAAAMFILGCIIQFQMAFGGPILLLILPYIVYRTVRSKKYINLLMSLVIIVPLSSYILFELRHDFLQIRSVINYISGVENTGKVDSSFRDLLYRRINFLIDDSIGMITYNTLWITFLIGFSIVFAMTKEVKKFTLKNRYVLFSLLLVGYWALTLAYKGVIWGYYYWPFIGVIAIFFGATYKHLNRVFFIILFLAVLINNMQVLYWKTVDQNFKQGNWLFYKNIADKVFDNSPTVFGYFVYTTDLYGYSTRYSMSYTNRKNPGKIGVPNEKRSTTYLLIDDPGDLASTNHVSWKEYDVRISSAPMNIDQITQSYKIEKYELSDEQVQIPSNPFMLDSLIFR